MADGHGERVGRMVRLRRLGETENGLHHPLDLRLVGASVAADRLLDARGRVLSAVDACGRACDERGAACLPDGERDAGVGADERLLEDDRLRLVSVDELRDRVVDLLQTQFLALAGRSLPPAELDRLEAAAA